MKKEVADSLIAIADDWLRIARRKFVDAQTEVDPAGKRLIEHGAICYKNCADELKAALGVCEPQPSGSQLKHRE
jgi:hypothetical protein